MKKLKNSEVMYGIGLTPRVIIIILAMLFVAIPSNALQLSLSNGVGILPLSTIYLIFLNEIFSRLNPKWRLSSRELAVVFAAFWAIGGYSYAMYGELAAGAADWGLRSILMPVGALSRENLRMIWKDILPSFWYPSEEAVRAVWEGVAPGQAVGLSSWIVPIAFFSLWFMAWSGISSLLAFIMKEQMVKVERMPFAWGAPSIYTISWSTNEPKESPLNIFNLKSIFTKIFWVGFIIGALGTLPDILQMVLPAVPASKAWTRINVRWGDITSSVIPGAQFVGFLILPRVAVFTLMSLETLLTATLAWFVMFVIYPAVGVATGILPYKPGVENNIWYYAAGNGPIRIIWAGNTGFVLGMALWFLYAARSHVKRFFLTLYEVYVKHEEGIVEEGVAYHHVGAALLGFIILFLILSTASGVPFSIALLILLIYILQEIGNIYSAGEYPPGSNYVDLIIPYSYYAGGISGLWGLETPTTSFSLSRTQAINSLMDVRSIWTSNGRMFINIYKLADIVKLRAKDVLIISIIVPLIGIVYTNVFWIWWGQIYGIANCSVGIKGFNNAIVKNPIGGHDIRISHTIGGTLVMLLLYAARAKFPGLPINPLGLFLVGTYPHYYGFPNAVIAFAIKALSIKLGGIKFWETRVMPILIGFAMGYGFNYILIQWGIFATNVLPQIPI